MFPLVHLRASLFLREASWFSNKQSCRSVSFQETPNGGVDVARAATRKPKETTQRDNKVAARAHVQ